MRIAVVPRESDTAFVLTGVTGADLPHAVWLEVAEVAHEPCNAVKIPAERHPGERRDVDLQRPSAEGIKDGSHGDERRQQLGEVFGLTPVHHGERHGADSNPECQRALRPAKPEEAPTQSNE